MPTSGLPDISILRPAYNQIGSIAEILDLVKAALPGTSKEIIVIDDGSSDGTRACVSAQEINVRKYRL